MRNLFLSSVKFRLYVVIISTRWTTAQTPCHARYHRTCCVTPGTPTVTSAPNHTRSPTVVPSDRAKYWYLAVIFASDTAPLPPSLLASAPRFSLFLNLIHPPSRRSVAKFVETFKSGHRVRGIIVCSLSGQFQTHQIANA